MAYMNQQRKAAIAPKVRAICKQYGIKATLAVRNDMTLVLNIASGDIDFIQNYNDTVRDSDRGIYKPFNDEYMSINRYWYGEHFTGDALKFLDLVFEAMNEGNHDNSDIMTDYFDVGWYVDVNVGRWHKPYIVKGI